MRRICILLSILCLIFVGCSNDEQEGFISTPTSTIAPTSDPTPTPTLVPIPLVTYDDIKSGKYNEKIVSINCLITDVVYEESIDYLNFNVWLDNDSGYIDDGNWLINSTNNAFPALKNAKEGSVYEITFNIYPDSSFGASTISSAKKTDISIDLEDVYKQYKESCKTYTCDEILRTPKEYWGTYMSFTGEVFQVIAESDDKVEILLDTGEENGNIYVSYKRSIDEPRILEGDNITVYGIYYKLYNYTSVLGTNKSVPEIFAKFIEFTD